MENWKEVYNIQKSEAYWLGKHQSHIAETGITEKSQLTEAIEWCKVNCKEGFSVGLQPDYTSITFRFFNKDDYDWFSLSWGFI